MQRTVEQAEFALLAVNLRISAGDQRRFIELRPFWLEDKDFHAALQGLGQNQLRLLAVLRNFNVRTQPARIDGLTGNLHFGHGQTQIVTTAERDRGEFHAAPARTRPDQQGTRVPPQGRRQRLGRTCGVFIDQNNKHAAEKWVTRGHEVTRRGGRANQGKERGAGRTKTSGHLRREGKVRRVRGGAQVQHHPMNFASGKIAQGGIQLGQILGLQRTETDVAGPLVENFRTEGRLRGGFGFSSHQLGAGGQTVDQSAQRRFFQAKLIDFGSAHMALTQRVEGLLQLLGVE